MVYDTRRHLSAVRAYLEGCTFKQDFLARHNYKTVFHSHNFATSSLQDIFFTQTCTFSEELFLKQTV